MPKRIQLSRNKGDKLPPGAVKVDRTTKYGNPYRIAAPVDLKQAQKWGWNISRSGLRFECRDATEAVAKFRHALFWDVAIHDDIRAKLGGKDLACWCGRDAPCHADVLIEIANSDAGDISHDQEAIDQAIFRSAEAIAGQRS